MSLSTEETPTAGAAMSEQMYFALLAVSGKKLAEAFTVVAAGWPFSPARECAAGVNLEF